MINFRHCDVRCYSKLSPAGSFAELVPQLWLDHSLANLGATVGAFIGELDLRHGPMRLDVAHEHWKANTARTNHEGRLDIVVRMDIGWHVGSPQGNFQAAFTNNP